MVSKIDNFTSVKKIAKGKYKFIVKDKPLYVLWDDNGNLPSEINGQIKVTYINGNEKKLDFSIMKLIEDPVFVEILE